MGYDFLFFNLMHIYGNYCGPNWSAGKHQGSVASGIPAINFIDRVCQAHDRAYKLYGKTPADRNRLDWNFVRSQIGKSGIGTAMALGVGGQALLRRITGYDMSGRLPIKSHAALSLFVKPTNNFGSHTPSIKAGLAFPSLLSSKRMKTLKRNKRPHSLGKYKKKFGGKGRSFTKRKFGKKFKPKSLSKRTKKHYSKKRKSVKRQRPTYATEGSQIKYETGGLTTVANREAVYLGHSVSANRVRMVVFRAIVRKLALMSGYDFVSFDEPIAYTLVQGAASAFVQLQAQIIFRASGTISAAVDISTSNIAFLAAGVATTNTWGNLADQMATDFATAFVQTNYSGDDFELVSFHLKLYDGVNSTIATASLQADQLSVDFSCKSTMVYQNRTNDANNEKVDTNSPNFLQTKLYHGQKHWCSGVKWQPKYFRGNAGASYMVPDTFGHISMSSAGGAFPEQQESIRKLPAASIFDFKHATPGVVGPGQYLRDNLKFSTTIALNKLFRIYISQWDLAAATETNLPQFGWARFIGFEFLLSDRTETTEILVSFELNQMYSAVLNVKKLKLTPEVVIVG